MSIRGNCFKKYTVTKIKNAKSQIYDNVKFKSSLEVYCYKKLKENNIISQYEGITFTLIEAFTYNGEKVRKMQYTPDFVSDSFVIECKGMMNQSFPLRWKLFKLYLYSNNIEYKLFLPRNKKDVDDIINEIIDEKNKRRHNNI